ncbi:MAG: PIG-L deacetylase family protein [Anaerolineales bacterium]|jgi:LmbE family N-acetylglucosaminyl deacetylase
MIQNSVEISAPQLKQNAIIFAPHQDDETLGCGGTIIKKRRAGADVHIVFTTDGRHSHDQIMPQIDLAALRMDEAIAAANVLGVSEENIDFLGYEDGRLQLHTAAACEKVVNILTELKPAEIFVPYHYDGPADHIATWQIVMDALNIVQNNVKVYEYPVWFWYNWPWVSVPFNKKSEAKQIVLNSLSAGFGFRMVREFRHSVFIGDVLVQKQRALSKHQSQMARLEDDPRSLTLQDVSNGEWLVLFFQKYELFHLYSLQY